MLQETAVGVDGKVVDVEAAGLKAFAAGVEVDAKDAGSKAASVEGSGADEEGVRVLARSEGVKGASPRADGTPTSAVGVGVAPGGILEPVLASGFGVVKPKKDLGVVRSETGVGVAGIHDEAADKADVADDRDDVEDDRGGVAEGRVEGADERADAVRNERGVAEDVAEVRHRKYER